jgi:carboxypeptidase family protein
LVAVMRSQETHRRAALDTMRRKLSASFALAAPVLLAACELHQGQIYPAGGAPRFEATRTCESSESSTTSHLRVIVLDSSKVPVANATVRIGEAGGTGEGALVQTDEKGAAEVDVAAGRWQIDVTASALAPARYELELPSGQKCVVRITLHRGEDVFPF